MSERLTGQELLAHVKSQLEAGYTRDDAARTAGYIKGKLERTDKVAFEHAFNAALGITTPEPPSVTKRNRKPSGSVTVHKGGGTTLSVAYMKLVGAVPGDRFAVSVEGETIMLHLVGPEAEVELSPEESEDADCEDVELELVAA